MFTQRALARTAQRVRASPVVRNPVVRRQKYSSEAGKQFAGAEDNEFNRERARVKEHAAESGELWRKLSIYVAIPALIVAAVNAKIRWDAHWEHVAHAPPPEERPQYPYLNIRTKNFWWGDGDKTLFWNDKVNYHKRDDE